METEKKKRGKPPKKLIDRITSRFSFDSIKKLAECGLIDEDFANVFKIDKRTWQKWKKQDPEFEALLKNGKRYADLKAEQFLFKRVQGYEYQETTKELVGKKLMVTKIVTKQVAPDVGAIAFWLKNRKSDVWKERTNLDLGNNTPESLSLMLKAAGQALRGEC